MNRILLSMTVSVLCGAALARLPPPDDATKAKAAEAAAKNAWQAKVDGYLLCKAQDRVAAVYAKTSGKPAAKEAPPATTAAAQPAAPAASSGARAASAAPPAGTPVASALPPPCMEPGPLAANAPAQTPLETSGAHSPAGTAASPPSVKQDSATMNPAKKP